MVWARNGTPDTLSSAGDNIDITDQTATKFNQYMLHVLTEGAGIIQPELHLNGVTGTEYAHRYSSNGGADGTGTTTTDTWLSADVDEDKFVIGYFINIAAEEKLAINHSCMGGTATAAYAPNRYESVTKWANTSVQSGEINIDNDRAGNFDTNSNLSALSGDVTEEAILGNNVQSGSRFEATDTRKIYYGVLPSVTFEDDFSSDSGWTHSSQTSVSGGVLNWDHEENTSNVLYYTTKSLGTTLSDTKWVMTFDLRIDNLTLSGSIPDASSYGLYLSSSSANADYHDALAFAHYFGSGSTINKFRIYYSDSHVNTYLPSSRNTDFTTTPTASTTYYITLVRESATSLKGYIYSDSARTTLLDSQTLTIPSTVTSLAYVRFIDFDGNDTGTFTPTDGHIDNIKVYDGVTSTDFTWTEEV